jgi:hypothetical protein
MLFFALAFFIAAVLGPLAYAAIRGLRLYRTFRAVSRRAAGATGRVAASTEAAERRAAVLPAKSEALAAATARLSVALEELSVLRQAAAEPGALATSVRRVVPRK